MENEIFLKTSKVGFAEEQTLDEVLKEAQQNFVDKVQEASKKVLEEKDKEKAEKEQKQKQLEKLNQHLLEIESSDLNKEDKEWLQSFLKADFRNRKLMLNSLAEKSKTILEWLLKLLQEEENSKYFIRYIEKYTK